MKDIYELLNEVNIDADEFEEMDVSESEKAKVNNALKRSIKKKKKRTGWKMNVAAAAMVFGLSVTTLSLAFPTYASNIPIIGDIFKFLDNENTGVFDNYKEFSTDMNLAQDSNGIKVTMNDTVFDGTTISMTYTIESEKALDEEFMTLRGEMPDIKDVDSMIGSFDFSKVDDYHYVALSQFTPLDSPVNNKKEVAVKWNINSFLLEDTETEVKGDWNFAFSVKATENQVQLSNQSTGKNGVYVAVEKLTFTPMSFILHYTHNISGQSGLKPTDMDVELAVRDDLGKTYAGETNGGTGNDEYTMNWSETFEKLDPKATKLIITPTVTSLQYDSSASEGEMLTNSEGTSVTTKTNSKSDVVTDEFVLEDIIIDIEK